MTSFHLRLRTFGQELRRRRVLRVAIIYAAAGWVAVESSDTIAPLLLLPDWTSTLVLVLLLLGLPLALGLAWSFDITTEGVRRTEAASSEAVSSEAAGSVPPSGRAVAARGGRARWTAQRIAVVGAVAVLALAGLATIATWTSGPEVVANRVAVVPFENRTGDPSLDPLGVVAADWIGEGLSDLAQVQVVLTTTVLEVLARAAHLADPLPLLAKSTQAGLAITGSFNLAGDSVELRAQLIRSRERRLIRAVQPVRGHRSDPGPALSALRQSVLSHLFSHLSLWGEVMFVDAPTYHAHQAYVRGMELFADLRYPEAIAEFDRARAGDSTFLAPLLRVAVAFGNMRQPAQRDSVLRILAPLRGELSEEGRVTFDWLEAYVRGDLPATYRHASDLYARAPGGTSRYLKAMYALQLNRPRETVELLRGEPEGSAYRARWVHFHGVVADAWYVLGKHRQGLKAAHEGRSFFPGHPNPIVEEARALAALGRTAQAEARVDELLMLPSAGDMASSIIRIGDALAAHGHGEAAGRVYARALHWLEEREFSADPGLRQSYAAALRRTGRLAEAASHTEALHAANPSDRTAHAVVGIVAAQRGDRALAERIEAELARREDPYDHGGNTYNRARIRARLGDLDRAVELLRQAHAEGQPIAAWIRMDPDLEPLRAYPAFRELVRPRG
jgi:tetratricopeptide (TPR) repeat protein/TolB-like protein